LLLVADAPFFRVGYHEYGVDGHFNHLHVGGEGISEKSMGESDDRLGPCRLGFMDRWRNYALAKIKES
jgi:hypothetical protein